MGLGRPVAVISLPPPEWQGPASPTVPSKSGLQGWSWLMPCACSKRSPMHRADRRRFFALYAFGLTLLIATYALLTIMRSIRDDFAVEIWRDLGRADTPTIFAYTETLVMLGVVAINGAAMGAGLDMALMCDMRVCSDTAKLAETYISMGLAPGDGGAFLLPRLIGLPRAMEMLLTGDVISPEKALEIGLVNRVVSHDDLMDETMKLARKIASKPPLATRMTKRAVMQGLRSDFRSHLDYISSQLSLLSQTEDHREAASAFLERRKPEFRGR